MLGKKIKLTQGKYALVDEEDFEYLNQFKWHFDGLYGAKKSPKKIYMHRLLMNSPKGMEIDHINQNKLDNRKSNLRVVNRSLNMFNVGLRKTNTSGHKGIGWNKNKNKWHAKIMIDYKNINLGYFSNIKDAINARKNAEPINVGNMVELV